MNEYIIDNTLSYQSRSGLLLVDVSQFREEVVRCRDCKYCEVIEPYGACCLWFNRNLQERGADGFEVFLEGWCYWGERKDENGR